MNRVCVLALGGKENLQVKTWGSEAEISRQSTEDVSGSFRLLAQMVTNIQLQIVKF